MVQVGARSTCPWRYLQPKTYIDVLGKTRTLGKGKYIPTTGRNGTADISGVFKGVPLSVEVKIGRDKMSSAQKAYRADFERAGGWYCIAKDFDGFIVEFQERFGDGY